MTAGTQSRKPLGGSHRKLGPLILGAILLVAFALRLYGLNAGLWYDEILTSINYARMSFFQIITTYDSQNQHFLFSLLARASILIFGESAWALRLPAVIFGVASIWALYLLGREIGSETEALLSAALLTFSYHHIWFSQNARGYTGLLFWTILSSWLLLRALREGRPRLWLLYAAAAALGMYTHLTMIFVIIGGHFAVYLAAFLFRRRESWPSRWSGMFLGFGLSGFFTLLLYAPALPQFAGGFFGEEGNVITWKNPLWTLLEVARGMQLGFAGAVAALVALLVFGAGLFIVLRTNPALIQLLIIPAVLGAGVTLATGHYVWPRFFFFAIGFAVLVAVRGATLVGRAITRWLNISSLNPDLVGTAFSLALILVSALSVPFVYGPKQDYVGALAYVEARKEPGDAVVTVGLATLPYARYFRTGWDGAPTLEALNSIRSRAERTWLVYTLPIHLEGEYPEIMESIRRDFKVLERFDGTLSGGAIVVCLSDTPPSTLSTSGADTGFPNQ